MNPRLPCIVLSLMLGPAAAGPLPGTRPLTLEGDLAARTATESALTNGYPTNTRKCAGRTEIEFFDGGHEIHAQALFRFLHKHLEWPEPH